MDRPTILSLGSINADFQVRTPRALKGGETLLATDFVRRSGGKAANVEVDAERPLEEAPRIIWVQGRWGD
jgi:ribokinase